MYTINSMYSVCVQIREILYVKLNHLNLHLTGTNVCTIAVVWCHFTMHIVNGSHLYSLNKVKENLT
ncbi:hypothetical protein PGIGA_G00019160 [Pangasianodon gigas]|uniref:Uncharacterized protein n=1 Tax=Pangasianodon gigas TaxID=30993 RepID=A0ACC5WX03_PANGG|nr:hypothetical protein [Pangasianodon gigas]